MHFYYFTYKDSMWLKKITVRHKRWDCIWCASCALIAPENWTMSQDDGLATLVWAEWKSNDFMVGQIDEDQLLANKEASEACPTRVIYISDGQSWI